MTTRFAGELPLDALPAPARPPATPASPEPSLLEVTQPFMPAIREQAPEFTKRLSPEVPAATATAPPAPARSAPVESDPAPLELPTEQAAPPAHDLPVETAPPSTAAPAPQDVTSTPRRAAAPKKRRSLARRVVRRILGPDLLRKDPKHR